MTLHSNGRLLSFLLVLTAGSALQASEPACPVTRLEDRLPGVIAPMAGEDPIWLVDGAGGRWSAPDALVKSQWVLSRRAEGDLTLEGRRLDGPGTLRFRPSGVGTLGDLVASVRLAPNDRAGVIPGGASAGHLSDYEFVPMYLVYPSPGCWRITARLGAEERHIVLEMVDPRGRP